MRRHLIVGRFGAGDRVPIPKSETEVLTRLEFVASNRRLEHGIGRALRDLTALGVFPTESGLDLLVLAAHVHAADTRICRATESQDTWTREIRLVVPVRNYDRWTEAIPLLQRLLNFLTGDRWRLGFRPRPAGFEVLVPLRPQLVRAPFDDIALFSGGLDSLIGAIDRLEQGRTPLFISHAGEGATSDSQNTLFDELKNIIAHDPLIVSDSGWLSPETLSVTLIPNRPRAGGRSCFLPQEFLRPPVSEILSRSASRKTD